MFELKLPESDESDDTPRAAHERLFRLAVRIGTFLAIWMMFSSLGAKADEMQGPASTITIGCQFPVHLWCNSVSGQCGVHWGFRPDGTPVP